MISTVLLYLFATAFPAGPPAAVDPSIFRNKAAGERASFLVVFRDKADLSGAAAIADRGERRRFVYDALRARAEASQADVTARLSRDGVPFRRHFLVNMLEVEADAATAAALSSVRGVLALVPNRASALRRVDASDGSTRPRWAKRIAAIEPNVGLVGAPDVWERGFRGQGIVIGIADTGVDWQHPALREQYRGWDAASSSVAHDYNWHDAVHTAKPFNTCGVDTTEPCDDQGHGTSVAGLAVGDDGGENRIGVAPGAKWIGCRNMDLGDGSPARYVECFEFFLAPTDATGQNPRPELGADVVNNSWTCPEEEGCTDPEVLREAVEGLRAAGIAGAFAAGNSGPGCFSLRFVPSIYDAAFSVGATDLDDTIAIFSARGPVTLDGSQRLKPDIVAPGVAVRSCARTVAPQPYTLFGGTSGATPHVSGAIALLWSALPRLAGRVDETIGLLEASAVRLTSGEFCGVYPGTAVPNPVFGWGRLDVAAAFALATERGEPAPSGVDRPEPRVLAREP